MLCKDWVDQLGKSFLKSGKAVTPGHVSSLGVPSTLYHVCLC